MKLTLTNDFHNTSTTINVVPGEFISAERAQGIRDRLCGSVNCKCSGYLGTRGRQPESPLALELGEDPGTYEVVEKPAQPTPDF